ncbi:MAG: heavy metal-responsive transcriptional regulator [Acidobacteria bacterium]|nr:heavy metal-responsive transcriptional regulator [Acidobacteriota bacterium]
MSREGFFIGEVARETGLSIHTLRFYEAERLLPESPRTESGYRVYSAENVEKLKFIRQAQELGFTLKEIRELLVLKDRGTNACGHVQSLLEEKLENTRTKRRELERLEKELRRRLAQCRRQLKRQHPGPEKDCPVLIRLGREPGAV